MTLRVSAFGGLTVTGPDGAPYPLRGVRQRALLAYLAVSPAHDFSRTHLAELLWPDAADEEARHSLRQCLSTIRRELGSAADVVTLAGDRVRLESDRIETDVDLLARLANSSDPSDWRKIGDVYRGELLAGIDVGGTPFDDWLVLQRRLTNELAMTALARVAEAQSAAGDIAEAIVTTRRIVLLDPFDEAERRRLMRLLAQHGRSTSAIAEYRELSKLLHDQLDVEPSIETRRLYRSLLDGAREALPGAGVDLLQSYAHALEQIPDCVVVTDLATRIVGFSPVAEHQFGLRKEEVMGKTPAILHAGNHETVFPLQFTQLALTHGRWTETVRLTAHDGNAHQMRRSVVTLRSPSGQAIGAFGVSVL